MCVHNHHPFTPGVNGYTLHGYGKGGVVQPVDTVYGIIITQTHRVCTNIL